MYLKKFLLIFCTLSLFISCEEDAKSPSFEKDLLYGRWELTEAYRNSRKTETLTGTFYEFNENGNVKTNFTPQHNMVAHEFPFDFNGKEIKLKGEQEFLYQVDTLSQDLLMVSTNFDRFRFKFTLNKADSVQLELDKEL